jgi:mannitol-1-/sugar-/sorbitol-6-/2-deoxyglucose-6-phosphatase
MSIEAIIFDMDGVLVDSEPYWTIAREAFAAARGKVWTDALQRQAMGRSTVEWAHVMQENLELSESLEAIIDEMMGRVIAQYEEKLPERPGAIASVKRMATKYRVALASGSPTSIIQRIMQLTGLDQVFEVTVYGDTIPNGKPAPDIYIEGLRRMGVLPSASLGIEDSANGIRSLRAAGMRIIAAPSPAFPLGTELLAMADAHIISLEDLSLELIAEIDSR